MLRSGAILASCCLLTLGVATALAQGKGYFPEEEEHIAAYLNLEFYHFKP